MKKTNPQVIIIIAFAAFIVLFLVFMFFMFNRYRWDKAARDIGIPESKCTVIVKNGPIKQAGFENNEYIKDFYSDEGRTKQGIVLCGIAAEGKFEGKNLICITTDGILSRKQTLIEIKDPGFTDYEGFLRDMSVTEYEVLCRYSRI